MATSRLVLGRNASTHEFIWMDKESRLQGTYVLGKTGYGKSSLLASMIIQDMLDGYGVGVLDPHGELIIDVLSGLPPERRKDVVLLDLKDDEFPFAFNLFDCAEPTNARAVAQMAELVTAVFKRVWGEAIGARSQDLLENTVYTMIANPGATLDDVPKFFSDQATRRRMVRHVPNDVVRSFWEDEFDPRRPADQQQITAPILNKIRTFLRHPVLRDIVRQPHAPDFDAMLRERKILLVRLDQELTEASSLLGTLITRRILQAAFGRAGTSDRHPFFLYADEFQRFATPDFGTLLQEARKFGIGTILAHQLRSQLDRELRSFVLGASTIVCFQLSADDAREMGREFPKTRRPISSVMPADVDPLTWFWETDHLIPSVNEIAHEVRVMTRGWRKMEEECRDAYPWWWAGTEAAYEKIATQLRQAVLTRNPDLILPFDHRTPDYYSIYKTPEGVIMYNKLLSRSNAIKNALRAGVEILRDTTISLEHLPLLTAQARLSQQGSATTMLLKVVHLVVLAERKHVQEILEHERPEFLPNVPAAAPARLAHTVRQHSRLLFATPRVVLNAPPAPKHEKTPVNVDANDVIFYDEPDEEMPPLPWQ